MTEDDLAIIPKGAKPVFVRSRSDTLITRLGMIELWHMYRRAEMRTDFLDEAMHAFPSVSKLSLTHIWEAFDTAYYDLTRTG